MNCVVTTIGMVVLFSSLFGCKTAEEIRRERMVDDLSVQVVKTQEESKKVSETSNQQIQELQEQLRSLSSQYEDLLQQQTQSGGNVEERVQRLEERQEQLESYIKQVLEALKKLGTAKGGGKTTLSSPPKSNPFQDANNAFQRGDYKKARPLLETLLQQSSNLTAGQKNNVYHNLGVIEYEQGQFEKAIIYLSKIYTQYPQSSMAPSSLYHIGLALKKLGKSSEAKQSFEEVVKKYPQSDSASKAKKALKGL